MENLLASHRRFVARWHEIKRSPRPFRAFAENFSAFAREALAESQNLIIERETIYFERLPREFDGLRVVQLTDIHHSPTTSAAQIREAVEIANSLNPDLTVLTGDYVSHETQYIAPVAEMLGKLKAKNGVFAVLGNHDHWTDAALITDLFRAEGITMLTNEGVRLRRKDARIWLCGVDDTMVGQTDLTAALRGSLEDEFKFLLCHNPAILRRAERVEIDFVASGHTHGGQVRLRPANEGLIRPKTRRASGLHQRGKTQIYISRGIGTVVVPLRYQCPPELTLDRKSVV